MSKSRLDYNKSGSTGTLSKLTKSYSSSVSQSSKSPPTVSTQENGGERKPAPEREPPRAQDGLVNKMVEEVKAVSPVMEESATEDEEALVIDKVRSRSFKI